MAFAEIRSWLDNFEEEAVSCLICLETVKDPRMCRFCSKMCCNSCITPWLSANHRCPHCSRHILANDLVQWRDFENLMALHYRIKVKTYTAPRLKCAVHCAGCENCYQEKIQRLKAENNKYLSANASMTATVNRLTEQLRKFEVESEDECINYYHEDNNAKILLPNSMHPSEFLGVNHSNVKRLQNSTNCKLQVRRLDYAITKNGQQFLRYVNITPDDGYPYGTIDIGIAAVRSEITRHIALSGAASRKIKNEAKLVDRVNELEDKCQKLAEEKRQFQTVVNQNKIEIEKLKLVINVHDDEFIDVIEDQVISPVSRILIPSDMNVGMFLGRHRSNMRELARDIRCGLTLRNFKTTFIKDDCTYRQFLEVEVNADFEVAYDTLQAALITIRDKIEECC